MRDYFSSALRVLREFIRGDLTVQIQIPLGSGITVNKWHHFTDAEVTGLDTELVARLDLARERAQVPFLITSGLRTQEDNITCGGVSDSAHLRGLAVDLACSESGPRYAMVSSLLQVGFNRVGIYLAHIHCDLDLTLPPNVMWVGLSTR